LLNRPSEVKPQEQKQQWTVLSFRAWGIQSDEPEVPATPVNLDQALVSNTKPGRTQRFLVDLDTYLSGPGK